LVTALAASGVQEDWNVPVALKHCHLATNSIPVTRHFGCHNAAAKISDAQLSGAIALNDDLVLALGGRRCKRTGNQ
jgi:5,10-methylenetetrahydrofolate reductase